MNLPVTLTLLTLIDSFPEYVIKVINGTQTSPAEIVEVADILISSGFLFIGKSEHHLDHWDRVEDA